jgi:upstream activation factor subunit UAF30
MATAKKAAKSAKKAPAKKAAAKKAPAKGAARKGATAKSTAKKGAAKGATRSATKSTAKKAPAAKKSTAKKSARQPNAAFMKPMRPSSDLAAVVGANPQPRSEITKRVWDYIKKNNLQDAKNRRQINADDKLRPVFGGKKNVTMFEMTKLVNNHLSDA